MYWRNSKNIAIATWLRFNPLWDGTTSRNVTSYFSQINFANGDFDFLFITCISYIKFTFLLILEHSEDVVIKGNTYKRSVTDCPVCGAQKSSKNFKDHLRRAHKLDDLSIGAITARSYINVTPSTTQATPSASEPTPSASQPSSSGDHHPEVCEPSTSRAVTSAASPKKYKFRVCPKCNFVVRIFRY